MVGDSVTLLARFHNVDIRDFLKSRMLLNSDLFSPDNIDEHLRVSNTRREHVSGWSKFSRDRRYQELIDHQIRDLLVQTRLMQTFQSPNWRRSAGLLFGVATIRELATHFPAPYGRPHEPRIIFPLFSAPNCMAGLEAIDGASLHQDIWFGDTRDVLTFLHRPIRGKFIVASPSQPHVAALHIMAQNSQASYPPPVVGFNDDTLTAWKHLEAEEIILWSPQPNVSLFTAAKRIGENARIAAAPVFSDNDLARSPVDLFIGHSATSMINVMRASSQPWLAALKDYIVSRASRHEIGRLPEKIALSPVEIERVHSLCRNDEEARIFDNVYRGGAIDITLTMPNGRKILQRPDGWYRVLGRGEPALISAAIPVVDTIIAYPDQNILSGYVKIGHHDPTRVVTTPFRIRENEFNADWLRDFCTRVCRRFAPVSNVIGRDLFDLATRMHQPKVVAGVNRLGWDAEANAFVLPRLTYRRHESGVRDASLVRAPHPFEQLPDPAELEFSDSAGFREIPAPALAGFLTGLRHIIAPVFGAEKTPTILECPTHEMAAQLTKVAAKALRLPYAGSPALNTLAPYLEQHDLPVFCHAENDSGLNACARHDNARNLIVVARAGLDFELSELLGWGRISVPDGPLECPALGSLFPLVLDFMFETDWTAPDAGHPLAWPADLLKKWARFTLETTHDATNDVIRGWRPPDSAGKRMLNLINCLVKTGYLGIKTQKVAVALDKDAVVATPTSMLVPLRGLRRAAAEANLPLPPADRITQRLKESGKLVEELAPLGQIAGWELAAGQ
jgi:hypothetical protein